MNKYLGTSICVGCTDKLATFHGGHVMGKERMALGNLVDIKILQDGVQRNVTIVMSLIRMATMAISIGLKWILLKIIMKRCLERDNYYRILKYDKRRC